MDRRIEHEGLITRLRVLVVDPYEGTRSALCSCMRELGHVPFPAQDLETATKLQPNVDVLIVDDSPPWFNGWSWVKALGTPTPAIVLLESEGASPALSWTLVKPVSLVDLECAIPRELARSALASFASRSAHGLRCA